MGVPEEAKVYEEKISSGAILVAAPTKGEDDTVARRVLKDNGAHQIRVVAVEV